MDTHQSFQEFLPFIRHSPTPLPLGRDGRIRVNYFIDLMSAVHEAALLDQLAEGFCQWLQMSLALDDYAGIVVPKRGNVLLVKCVADRLGKRCGFVKENILFGRWIEGSIRSGDRVLLMDDVASDGELLADAAVSLQRAGVFTDRAAVVVSRTEGDTEKLLAKIDVGFMPRFQLSDHDLGKLYSGGA